MEGCRLKVPRPGFDIRAVELRAMRVAPPPPVREGTPSPVKWRRPGDQSILGILSLKIVPKTLPKTTFLVLFRQSFPKISKISVQSTMLTFFMFSPQPHQMDLPGVGLKPLRTTTYLKTKGVPYASARPTLTAPPKKQNKHPSHNGG